MNSRHVAKTVLNDLGCKAIVSHRHSLAADEGLVFRSKPGVALQLPASVALVVPRP